MMLRMQFPLRHLLGLVVLVGVVLLPLSRAFWVGGAAAVIASLLIALALLLTSAVCATMLVFAALAWLDDRGYLDGPCSIES
jgi:hypothetical protein